MKTLPLLRTLAVLVTMSAAGCAVADQAACDADLATSSVCDGRELVATCGDGQPSRTTCDDSTCPAGQRALGCRIGADDRPFCQCGCTDQSDVCLSSTTIRVCFGGEMIDASCEDECAVAGIGRAVGCERIDGRATCLCESK